MISDLPLAEKTASGLVSDLGMRSGAKPRDAIFWDAEVIAVCERFSATIPVGSHVKYDPYNGGYDMKWDGKECFVTKGENIVAIVENPLAVLEGENY